MEHAKRGIGNRKEESEARTLTRSLALALAAVGLVVERWLVKRRSYHSGLLTCA
jgi:hypothetical protein